MEQKEFSKLTLSFIGKKYPALLQEIQYHEDGSFDSRLKSPNGNLFVWIATYDCEITVGLEDLMDNCDCHTHMSLHGANGPYEELEAMDQLLDIIFKGELDILKSSVSGFRWSNDPLKDLAAKGDNEQMKVFKWNEL